MAALCSFVAFKNDTVKLRQAILDGIKQQMTYLNGLLPEWDILNEPTLHHEITDFIGRKQMVEWFRVAQKTDPDVSLFLNDYTMFHGEGSKSPSEVFFNVAKYLKDNGAPLNAIGEQGHIGGTPPGMEYMLKQLNHFAQLGLPIQISEFDITSDDDDFKARYMRDFLTMIYSHPATIGVVQWGFWEGKHWIPSAALWDKEWNLKPQGKVFLDLIHKQWSTNITTRTAKSGTLQTRGYKGDYEVTVIYKKQVTRKYFTLNDKINVLIKI